MPTDPLTSSRYPAGSDSPNIAQYIQNAVTDLADNTWTGPFATTTARDTAFSTWVSGGGTMRNGLHCHVTGVGDQVYLDGNWWTVPRLQYGQTSASISLDSQKTGAVTFPIAYPAGSQPWVLVSVVVAAGSAVDLLAVVTGNPTNTGFTWRVRERSATNVTVGASLIWQAML